MARQTQRLTARKVQIITEPGMYADGDGLYLVVTPTGGKRWALIYFGANPRKPGKTKRTEMGLGRLADVPLALAREKAADARRVVAAGGDPVKARKEAKAERLAGVVTFGQEADAYIAAQAPGFRNAKHLAQWRSTLSDTYCRTLRPLPVDQVSTANVLAVLKPLWQTLPETASRIRGRIERVLDAARAKGLRAGENPARWRGHLDKLLPGRQKLTRGHHAAMPYADVPALMSKLRGTATTGADALRFTILTAARTGETIGATADEFDLGKKLWLVPPKRMKAGREHRVPLSAEAVAIVRKRLETATSEYVFPGNRPRQPISNMTMAKTMRSVGLEEFTVHGMRSAFRDWAGDNTTFAPELAEAALAHVIGDATEQAYRRGDALEKRRKLMEAWEAYCSKPAGGNVVPMSRKKKA